MTAPFDIAVIGSGFGGSLLAMIARRLGRSVILIEREKHPRFAIGESSTPLANLLIEELATRYDLPRLLPLTKWATWQKSYPQIACGLKRGFTFYHHELDQPWRANPARSNELLVAASPHDAIADTHWFRAEVDQFFASEAQTLGADFLDETILSAAEISSNAVTLVGTRHGHPLKLQARFVIDATGPRGFLHRALRLAETSSPYRPTTEGLFTHFRNVKRFEAVCPSAESPPYPVDDAAMHHVFAHGWIWVLRFNNGLTSAGVAAKREFARSILLEEGAPAWHRLLERLPAVKEQFAGAEAARPFIHAPKLPFRAAQITGPGWALLPSAAGFIDPLLSTGFPLTLLGIARLGELIERHWQAPEFSSALDNYAAATRDELDAAELLVAALYRQMDDFPLFVALALQYFAAAIFTETTRRLGRSHLAGPRFLMSGHSNFGPPLRRACLRALTPLSAKERANFLDAIRFALEPFDLAGLTDPARRNWFPARAEDLRRAAPKLGVDLAHIENLLARCGFLVD